MDSTFMDVAMLRRRPEQSGKDFGGAHQPLTMQVMMSFSLRHRRSPATRLPESRARLGTKPLQGPPRGLAPRSLHHTSMSRVSASYKKQDGILSVSKDNRTVLWTPAQPPGAPPTLTIAVSDIASAFAFLSLFLPATEMQRG